MTHTTSGFPYLTSGSFSCASEPVPLRSHPARPCEGRWCVCLSRHTSRLIHLPLNAVAPARSSRCHLRQTAAPVPDAALRFPYCPRRTGRVDRGDAVITVIGCCHDLCHTAHDIARSDDRHAYLYSAAIDTQRARSIQVTGPATSDGRSPTPNPLREENGPTA
jgi:hypothetical protein